MTGRAVATIGALALAAVLALPATAAAGKHFRAYPSCHSGGKHGAAFCFEGDHPVAVLRAFDKSKVHYRFCFRQAADRKHYRDRHTHKAGSISVGRDKLVIRERAVFVGAGCRR